MNISNRLRLFAGAIVLGMAAFGLSSASRADIVANTGTIPLGDTAVVGCDTTTCTTTDGTAGQNLPASGNFVHQIHFAVSQESALSTNTLILNPATIDVGGIVVQLFEYVSGPTTVGAVNATGNLLATGSLVLLTGTSAVFELNFSPLTDGLKSYFIQITGGGTGCANSNCNYSEHLTISAVPLPPALLLLLTALGGLIGYSRIRRKKAVA